MSEHVSVETARKMAAAGWKPDWQVGDRYIWDDEAHGRDLRLLGAESTAHWFRQRQQDGLPVPLHLPTAGQILEALVNMGAWPDLWYTPLSRQWHCQTTHAHEKRAEIAEAVAACWLAVKEAEET